MRILVTGAKGLIGKAILDAATHHELIPTSREDADLRVYSECVDLITQVKPEAIIHCAAMVGGIGGNLLKGGEFFRDNILINTNVLEASRVSGVDNVTAFLSTCIFPDQATYPLTVSQLHQGEPHPSNFAYAHAKRMLDIQVKAYNSQWGTRFKLLIPTNVYGRNDNFSLTEGHVTASLIHRMHIAKTTASTFIVWGTGQAKREFVHASDIASIALLTAELPELSRPLIVTNSTETTILELVEEIRLAFDFAGEVSFDESKPDGQLRKPSSPEELQALFPGYEFLDLRSGINDTVNWFLDEYPKLRK